MESIYINALTPFVQLRYLYLAKMDNKFDPKYSVDMVLDRKDKEHAKFIKELMELNKKAGEELLDGITKGKKDYRIKDIFKEEEDADGKPTGYLILKCTTKNKPIVKDCEGKTLDDSFVNTLGNGTVGRVKLCLKKSTVSTRKTVGLTCYMSTYGGSVQVKEPVIYTGGDDGGFDKADGFVAPDTTGGADDF